MTIIRPDGHWSSSKSGSRRAIAKTFESFVQDVIHHELLSVLHHLPQPMASEDINPALISPRAMLLSAISPVGILRGMRLFGQSCRCRQQLQ